MGEGGVRMPDKRAERKRIPHIGIGYRMLKAEKSTEETP